MKVNEIFYSIQGEGYYTGRAAVFIRFSGCNLKCPFCDTNHSEYLEMDEDDIVNHVKQYNCDFVVLTGGEPSLQVTETLIDKLHLNGMYVTMETNGTKEIPQNIDWVTVSPKYPYVGNRGKVILKRCDELKVVFDGNLIFFDPTFGIEAFQYYMQPCDTGDETKNKEIVRKLINFIKNNNQWKISLQTQKILNVR